VGFQRPATDAFSLELIDAGVEDFRTVTRLQGKGRDGEGNQTPEVRRRAWKRSGRPYFGGAKD
jgi:hypothetical protein